MIQRKQTLFLMLAVVAALVCLCLPIGSITPEAMGVPATVYNLWIDMGNGSHRLAIAPLFFILLLTCPIAVVAILKYRNRRLQAVLCRVNMLLLLAWYAAYMCYVRFLPFDVPAVFSPQWASVLPFVSCVLHYLALRGIRADEALVRSMDRIR